MAALNAQENEFIQSLRKQGLIDERNFVISTDVTASNGNSGRAWVTLSGDTLRLFALESFTRLGELIETIDLKQARLLKAVGNAFVSTVKLESGGVQYTFRHFIQARTVVTILKEAMGA